MADRLFDEATLRKLERLALIANKVRAGAIKGERRSIRRGTSLEFADYRNYTRGDDLRRLDWNLYARLERPFLKLFEEEEDLAVHVIVDASASMDWPEVADDTDGTHHKFRYALQLAGALAHIGLATGDQVSVALLRGDVLAERWGPARGRGRTLQLLRWLEAQATSGQTDLDAALADYARRAGRPGLALVISDMLSPSGYVDGLNALQGRGNEAGLLHVLAPEEIEPPLAGDVRLVDVETGEPQDVSVNGAMRDLYRRRLLAWRDEMAAHCAGRDAHYVAIETGTPWEEVVLYELRRAGMVK